MYNINDIVLVKNAINPDLYPEEGTIVFIEEDNELPILWLYIKAKEDSLNKEYDKRFGKFWIIREHESNEVYLK